MLGICLHTFLVFNKKLLGKKGIKSMIQLARQFNQYIVDIPIDIGITSLFFNSFPF